MLNLCIGSGDTGLNPVELQKFSRIGAGLVLVGLELWSLENRIRIHTDLTWIRDELQRFRFRRQIPRVWSDFTVLFT